MRRGATDPVCGMKVDKHKAIRMEIEGKPSTSVAITAPPPPARGTPGSSPHDMSTPQKSKPSLTERPAWAELAGHHRDRTHTCATCSPPTPPAASADGRGRRPLPRLLQAPHHRRDASPAARARRAVGLRRAHRRRCSLASASTSRRIAPSCTSPCACRASASLMLDGVDVVEQVHAVLDRMAVFSEQVRSGDWTRPHRPADPQRRQHRHRRLGSRPGDGL